MCLHVVSRVDSEVAAYTQTQARSVTLVIQSCSHRQRTVLSPENVEGAILVLLGDHGEVRILRTLVRKMDVVMVVNSDVVTIVAANADLVLVTSVLCTGHHCESRE